MKFSLPVACVAATLAVAASVPVWAQQVDSRTFNAVGTWSFLTNWQKMEQPFWTEDLPKATGGKLKGNIKSITEVNLKGTEVIRLMKQGVLRNTYVRAPFPKLTEEDRRDIDLAFERHRLGDPRVLPAGRA